MRIPLALGPVLTARALVTQLRLAALVRSSTLPSLLESLMPAQTEAPEVPRELVERAFSNAQRIVRRLRFVPNTCLYRALTRFALLRGAGHPARFVMALDPRGGAGPGAKIEGHAWVELHGKAVGEEVDPRYVVTFAYPT